jgi:hypothetical protein
LKRTIVTDVSRAFDFSQPSGSTPLSSPHRFIRFPFLRSSEPLSPYARPANPEKATACSWSRAQAVDHASWENGIPPGDEMQDSAEHFAVRRRDGRAVFMRCPSCQHTIHSPANAKAAARTATGKPTNPGTVRDRKHVPEQFQGRQNAQCDKSWSAANIDIDELIEQVCAYDRYVGASIHLIHAFGLRRKEAVMLRPRQCVVPFEVTGIKLREVEADCYLRIKEGTKGGRLRLVPIDTPERISALAYAQTVAEGQDAHMGAPERGSARQPASFRLCGQKVRHHELRGERHAHRTEWRVVIGDRLVEQFGEKLYRTRQTWAKRFGLARRLMKYGGACPRAHPDPPRCVFPVFQHTQ